MRRGRHIARAINLAAASPPASSYRDESLDHGTALLSAVPGVRQGPVFRRARAAGCHPRSLPNAPGTRRVAGVPPVPCRVEACFRAVD